MSRLPAMWSGPEIFGPREQDENTPAIPPLEGEGE